MRRAGTLVSVLALALIGVGVLAWSPGLAQDGTPVPTAGHPIVGAWVLDPDDDPSSPPATAIFHDDGSYIEVDADGSTGIGSWEATGPTTADVTFMYHFLDDGGVSSSITVWATVTVDATTDALTAEYTIEFVPKVKVEVAVTDAQVPRVLETITRSAKTGSIGDGKIFVRDLASAIRIRTGETGESAL